MGSPRPFWLRSRPCFECGDARRSTFFPWIELLIDVEFVSAEIAGYKGHYVVTNDPFSTGNEFSAPCPYCTLPEDDFDIDSDFRD